MDRKSPQLAIAIEPLEHALRPVEQAETAYQATYAAVKSAQPMNKGAALDAAKRAQHAYHDACRRLCNYVRLSIDYQKTVAALERRMRLSEDDARSPHDNHSPGTSFMDDFTPQTLFPCRYHRLCQGYLDPAQPEQGGLCPDCFDKIDEGYEQVELEEEADRLAAEVQDRQS